MSEGGEAILTRMRDVLNETAARRRVAIRTYPDDLLSPEFVEHTLALEAAADCAQYALTTLQSIKLKHPNSILRERDLPVWLVEYTAQARAAFLKADKADEAQSCQQDTTPIPPHGEAG